MKKILSLLLMLVFCFSFAVTAFAEEGNIHYVEDYSEEPAQASESSQYADTVTQDASQPRLMVTDFSLEGNSISPDKESELSITLKNYSSTKAINNIKLTLTEETGDVKILGTGTQFVDSIGTGKTYVWKVKVTAAKTAAIGEHAITVSADYEDKYYTGYSSSDVLRVNVVQSVSLDYNGIQLPYQMVQEETASVDMSFINSGKSKIRNVKVVFDVDGLEEGATAYIGEIEPGSTGTASANLRAKSDTVGDIKGTATLTYEDEFGEAYSKTFDLETTIEKKAELPEMEEEEETSKYPLWWAFLLGGIVLGGTVGAIIPIAIFTTKQRKRDEEML